MSLSLSHSEVSEKPGVKSRTQGAVACPDVTGTQQRPVVPLPPTAAPWLVPEKTEGCSRNRGKPDSGSFQERSFSGQALGKRPGSLPRQQDTPQGTASYPVQHFPHVQCLARGETSDGN